MWSIPATYNSSPCTLALNQQKYSPLPWIAGSKIKLLILFFLVKKLSEWTQVTEQVSRNGNRNYFRLNLYAFSVWNLNKFIFIFARNFELLSMSLLTRSHLILINTEVHIWFHIVSILKCHLLSPRKGEYAKGKLGCVEIKYLGRRIFGYFKISCELTFLLWIVQSNVLVNAYWGTRTHRKALLYLSVGIDWILFIFLIS